jgi:hypothetical protein
MNFAGGPEDKALPEKAAMYSRSLAEAVHAICAQGHLNASAVLMGSASLVLSPLIGAPDIALRTIVATRFRREARYSVGAVNLNGLFRTTVECVPVLDHFKNSMTASIEAVRYSECNPEILERELEAVMRDRGVSIKQYMFFNNLLQSSNFSQEDGEVLARENIGTYKQSGTFGRSRSDHAAGDSDTRYERLQMDRADKDSKFMMEVVDLSDEAHLIVYVDRRSIPAGAKDILRAMERLTVIAASNLDIDATDLARRCWLPE